jgi:ABC transporter substrate binding protein (PQQ-dependent alcohol dehydrogenase system)
MRHPLRCSTAPRAFMRCLAAAVLVSAASLLSVTAAQAFVIGVIVADAEDASLAAAVSTSTEWGAVMAKEEHEFNAEIFGFDFDVVVRRASGPDDVERAAADLVEGAGAIALVGGFGLDEAVALGTWAAGRSVPFFNIGEPSDSLRHGLCQPTTFHIEPSAAMYLDALAGWYVRAGFRQWFVIQAEGSEGAALHDRLQWSLRERHFGARLVGRSVLPSGGDAAALVRDVRRANADLVVLLLPADEQVRVLAELEGAGLTTLVAGFPHPATQTRAFFASSREAAPRLGSDHRAAAWEATLDAYGAREINARFLERFGAPMDPSAWATYQAVKIVFEAAVFGGAADGPGIVAYLQDPSTVVDLWKGIGSTFRPWDRQLRQSLYLVKISATADDAFRLVTLVGELPAIYMPGTDPVERLDQLGDLANRSGCRS